MTGHLRVVPGSEPLVLDRDATDRLSALVSEIEEDPTRIRSAFPAAARTVARGALDRHDPTGILGPTVDDAVRGVLLDALVRAVPDHHVRHAEVRDLYRFGDSDEKRAVLRALPRLGLRTGAEALLHDALRSNDVRLVSAALGPYGAAHLDQPAWRHGVLKCLFIGVPLAAVVDLTRRRDAELVRMVAAYIAERRAAGRDVPDDAWLVVDPSDQEEN